MKLLLDMKQDLRSVNSVVIKRGDIIYADLSPVIGSEQGGIRPVLVIQNDIGNKYSPTIIVTAITSQINKAKLPTHVEINAEEYGITKDSVILLEQIRTIDKKRLKEKVGHLSDELMKKVDDGLQISFGLIEYSV
ncbi:MAG: transcriptional modulator of MazE/toxin, MazF [Clostridia bacterium]|jgi:mRNA interferase MazF|nr:transcriptional modulator of MazE/toxin, MazF [Clostridia bacterium]